MNVPNATRAPVNGSLLGQRGASVAWLSLVWVHSSPPSFTEQLLTGCSVHRLGGRAGEENQMPLPHVFSFWGDTGGIYKVLSHL